MDNHVSVSGTVRGRSLTPYYIRDIVLDDVTISAIGAQSDSSEQDLEELYAPVIEKYKAASQMSSYEEIEAAFPEIVNDWYNDHPTMVNYMRDIGPQGWRYAYYDIDSNGVPELIISAIEASGYKQIGPDSINKFSEVYALEHDSPLLVFSSCELWPVNVTGIAFMNNENLLYTSYANGPTETYHVFRMLSGGLSFEHVEGFRNVEPQAGMDYYLPVGGIIFSGIPDTLDSPVYPNIDPPRIYFSFDNEPEPPGSIVITSEEYFALVKKYEDAEIELDWIIPNIN